MNFQIHAHFIPCARERVYVHTHRSHRTATVASLFLWNAPLALAASPQLRLPSFEHLQRLATDSVNITIGQGPRVTSEKLDLAYRLINTSSPPESDRDPGA
jgi:hypothetical protein